MNITVDIFSRKVRADSLGKGEACVAKEGTLFLIIGSNSSNLTVRTRRTKVLPKVLVANLNTATLGFLKRDLMVIPVELDIFAKG